MSLLFSLALSAQQWEPMDLGFKFEGINSGGVKQIMASPYTGEIYVAGYFNRTGYGDNIPGFTKWISSTGEFDTTLVDRSVDCSAFNFYKN